MKTHKDIKGWFNQDSEKFFTLILNKLKNNDKIVEIGAYMGQSTCFIAQGLKLRNLKLNYDVVDHFKGSVEHQEELKGKDLYSIFIDNMRESEVLDLIKVYSLDSIKASTLYNNESLDFVFIDADHSYEAIKNDINSWLPKIKKGGILSGDDYLKCHPGVIKAVNEIFGKQVKFVGRCWYIEK